MATIYIYPPLQVTVSTGDLATAVKQDEQTVLLQEISDNTDGVETSLTSIDGKVLTDTQLRATPLDVSGPLTDAELRASAIDVDTGLIQGLTDTELRASAVEVDTGLVQGLTDAELRASAVEVDTGLSQGLTDTELRATPVPISGTVSTDGLTDTELRATPVDVLGPLTDAELRASAIDVLGPLTDTELRATAVPISAASLPLPADAATETTQLLNEAHLDAIEISVENSEVSLDNIDNATTSISGNTSNIEVATTSIDGKTPPLGSANSANSVPVVLASDQAAIDVLGPLTDSELRATAVDVSAAQNGLWDIDNINGTISLPTGAATETTLSSANTQLIDKLSGSLVPVAYDYIALTYVTVGDGIGEIETVVYKSGGSGGTTVKTLTLTYNGDDKLASVTAS